MSSLLVRPDMSGCLYPDCQVADTGPSHTRSGANYTGTCTVCQMQYRGETAVSRHSGSSYDPSSIPTCFHLFFSPPGNLNLNISVTEKLIADYCKKNRLAVDRDKP